MSTTISARLKKAASEFQAGDSIGFGIRFGKKYRDPKTKADDWTNYEAVIFAKSQGQIDFYRSSLVEGSVVTITCREQCIDSREHNGTTYHSIKMLNAYLDDVNTMDGAPQGHAPVQQGYQQPAPQQAPQQNYQQPPAQQPAPQSPPGYSQNQPQGQYQQPPQSPHNPNDPPF